MTHFRERNNPQLVLTLLQKHFIQIIKQSDYNYGILLVKNVLEAQYPLTSEILMQLQLSMILQTKLHLQVQINGQITQEKKEEMAFQLFYWQINQIYLIKELFRLQMDNNSPNNRIQYLAKSLLKKDIIQMMFSKIQLSFYKEVKNRIKLIWIWELKEPLPILTSVLLQEEQYNQVITKMHQLNKLKKNNVNVEFKYTEKSMKLLSFSLAKLFQPVSI